VNPDLSAFRDHGGKLLLLHGWADPAIPPTGTIDYYAAVQDRMGRAGRGPGVRAAVHVPGHSALYWI
jgi:fermentation-respiration switch protein FrsA (DUF1100 family)